MSETENQSTEAVETSTSDSAPMTSTPPADGSAAPGLNVGDLKKMVQIIQTCSKRGAFNADELEIVGQTYSNLVKFLVSTGAIKPAEKPADATATTEAPATEETASDPQTETPAEEPATTEAPAEEDSTEN